MIVLQELSNNFVLVAKMEVMTDYLSLSLKHFGHFPEPLNPRFPVSLVANLPGLGVFLFALCFFVCVLLFSLRFVF